MVLLSVTTFIQAADISGMWKSVDDKTGFVRAQIQIGKNNQGLYTGTILKTMTIPGGKPLRYCQNCPAPFTNKPVAGLQILSGFKIDPSNPNHYINGKILDPGSGRIYDCIAKLNKSGKQLRLRGYIGISAIGRSQTWIRMDE